MCAFREDLPSCNPPRTSPRKGGVLPREKLIKAEQDTPRRELDLGGEKEKWPFFRKGAIPTGGGLLFNRGPAGKALLPKVALSSRPKKTRDTRSMSGREGRRISKGPPLPDGVLLSKVNT